MLKIFHNPRCKKSRAGLEYLKTKTNNFEIREYLKEPLKEDEVREILLKMNTRAANLVRKQEELYKKELKGKSYNEDEWIKIILENPKLLQRPVIVADYKAVLGQPPEEIDVLFG